MKTCRLLTLNLAILLSLLVSHSAQGSIITFGSGGNEFQMEFVPIGNPVNAADTTGSPNPAGSVAYQYLMGKFEVSEDMITKYNANFGTANSLVITKDSRGTDKPATSVSWNEAARFVNWLNTSTAGFAAYKFTTSGVNDNLALWTAADTLDFDAANPFRSLRANYVLPSFDEWYKAAYYNPTTGAYFDYTTGSNTAPTSVAGGSAAGTAVYRQAGPADIMLAGGLSPFGTMGQGGNVHEWQETESDLINNAGSSARGLRGGYWGDSVGSLLSSVRQSSNPALSVPSVGFRVASLSSSADVDVVPEPGSLAIWGLMGLGGWLYRGRRRGRGHPTPGDTAPSPRPNPDEIGM